MLRINYNRPRTNLSPQSQTTQGNQKRIVPVHNTKQKSIEILFKPFDHKKGKLKKIQKSIKKIVNHAEKNQTHKKSYFNNPSNTTLNKPITKNLLHLLLVFSTMSRANKIQIP